MAIKKKNIKRLINNKTLNEAIEALLELNREGHGDDKVVIVPKIKRVGLLCVPEVNVILVNKKDSK